MSLNAHRCRVAAATAFIAFATLFGTVSHLVAEFFGLGWHLDASVVVSPQHGYLGGLALLALIALAAAVRMLPRTGRRARIDLLVGALPYRGRGPGFVAAAFLAQCGFSALTQIAEGYPLAGGDVVTGIVAGALAAVLGAVLITLGKRRVLAFALALVCALLDAACDRGVVTSVAAGRGATAPAARRTPFAFRYRPPPVAA